MDVELIGDIGQARVATIETKAQRQRRVRMAELCVSCATMLLEMAGELDPEHPALGRPMPRDPWRG